MKRTTKTALICLIILSLALCLTACAPEGETEIKENTEYIATADEFRSLSQKLGEKYSKTTFVLTADIDLGTDWTAIGGSLSDSFRGVLDGAGHTISYSVNVAEPQDRPETLEGSAVFGLFGYVFGATVKNLNLDYSVKLPALNRIAYSASGDAVFSGAQNTYIGGVAAYAYGDCIFRHITVNGEITATMGDILRPVVQTDGSVSIESTRQAGIVFAGGAVGYGVGNSDFLYVEVDADISVSGYGNVCRVSDVYAGGVAGYLRPVDITSDHSNPSDRLKIIKCSNTGAIVAASETANIGGIAGSVYNAEISYCEYNYSGEGLAANAMLRVNIGGIAGLADRCKINYAAADAVINVEVKGTKDVAFNAGGLFGQAVNFCDIENVYAYSEIRTQDGINCTAGGIAGVLSYSSLKDAAAEGGCFIAKSVLDSKGKPTTVYTGILDITIDYMGTGYSYYTRSGGVIGRLVGSSSLSDTATEFKAYQGVVGEFLLGSDVAVCRLALNENGKSDFEIWKEVHSLYDYSLIGVECLSVDIDADEVQYALTHTYKIADPALVNFSAANTRADKDKEVAASVLPNGIGTAEEDAGHLATIKNDVLNIIEIADVEY